MGMFDTIYFEDECALKKLKCSQGHQLSKDWQTKDFYCILESYKVEDHQLYKFRSRFDTLDQDAGTEEFTAVPYTSTIYCCDICKECKEWNEIEVVFIYGVVHSMKFINREPVVAKMEDF